MKRTKLSIDAEERNKFGQNFFHLFFIFELETEFNIKDKILKFQVAERPQTKIFPLAAL